MTAKKTKGPKKGTKYQKFEDLDHEDLIEKAIELSLEGHSFGNITKRLGITHYCWNRLIESQAGLKDTLNWNYKAFYEDRLRAFATEKTQGQLGAVIFLLKTRFRDEYAERFEQNISGDLKVSVNFQTVQAEEFNPSAE